MEYGSMRCFGCNAPMPTGGLNYCSTCRIVSSMSQAKNTSYDSDSGVPWGGPSFLNTNGLSDQYISRSYSNTVYTREQMIEDGKWYQEYRRKQDRELFVSAMLELFISLTVFGGIIYLLYKWIVSL